MILNRREYCRTSHDGSDHVLAVRMVAREALEHLKVIHVGLAEGFDVLENPFPGARNGDPHALTRARVEQVEVDFPVQGIVRQPAVGRGGSQAGGGGTGELLDGGAVSHGVSMLVRVVGPHVTS